MFKKIPGNSDYRIDLRGQVICHFGGVKQLKSSSKDEVLLEMFGQQRTVDLNWLKWLAWFECGIINNLEQHLDKIKFYTLKSGLISSRSGVVMGFTEPIYYKPGFRYIPCFPRYAIDVNGTILDTATNEAVTNIRLSLGYTDAYVYNPERCCNKNTKLHRLLALAWIPNTDFVNRPIINHLDGKRSNNRLENLEWCSLSDNSRHALDIGLNDTQIKMKSRDVVTGEVVIYKSLIELSKKIGTSSGNGLLSYRAKLPGYLYRRRYEIKTFDDESPWFYEDSAFDPDGSVKSIYTITVRSKKTGEITKFNHVRPFYKAYKLHLATGRLDDSIAAFNERYEDMEASYITNAVKGPYQVLDLQTKQISIFDSIWETGKFINRTRTEVQFDLSRGYKFIYSGRWIIGKGLGKIVISDYIDKPKRFRKILITDEADGSEITAGSMKHAARISGISFKSVMSCLKTGKCIKGKSFRTLD